MSVRMIIRKEFAYKFDFLAKNGEPIFRVNNNNAISKDIYFECENCNERYIDFNSAFSCCLNKGELK